MLRDSLEHRLGRSLRRSSLLALILAGVACSAGAGKTKGASVSAGGGSEDGQGPTFNLGGGAQFMPVNCGNGQREDGSESCDDGNAMSGDGCSSACLVEPGFICREPAKPCAPFARCGDGIVAFPEQCDDGGKVAGDGCSPSCKVELGFKCESGQPCKPTVCGDSVIEGAETCDQGPDVADDNCAPTCIGEPDCAGGPCTSSCGDGVVIAEACDDGNLINGDGCSSACQVEAGYTCSSSTDCDKDEAGNCILDIPAVFRDFPDTHPDFDGCTSVDEVVTGMVQGQLVGGKPVSTGKTGNNTCQSDLNNWYVSTKDNTTHLGKIRLYDKGDGVFVNRWGKDGAPWTWYSDYAYFTATYAECQGHGCIPCLWDKNVGCTGVKHEIDGTPLFFPVDGISVALDGGGFEAKVGPDYGYPSWPTEATVSGGSPVLHNFNFTTEVTYWFPYESDTSATLDFTGDDDVWVFVNGKLAVDLGNTHAPRNGSVTLNSTSAATFGLQPGNIYEIKVFQAERKRDGSSFRLSLEHFNPTRSECTPKCGDGIIGFGEECDDGMNDGGYNECQTGCVLGNYCGDGVVQQGEECDDADKDAPAGCSGCVVIRVK